MPDKPALLTLVKVEENESSSVNSAKESQSLLSILTEESAENNAVEMEDTPTVSSQPLFGKIEIDGDSETPAQGQLLQQIVVDSADSGAKPLLGVVDVQSDGAPEAEVVATEEVAMSAPADGSVSTLQYANYFSFITALILSGFAAVLIFRKASSFSAERLMSAGHLFALGCGVFVLHTFFNVYLYSTYLNGARETLPLAFALSAWVLVAPLTAVVASKAIPPASKANDSGSMIIVPMATLGAIGAMLAVLEGLSSGLAITFAAVGLAFSAFPGYKAISGYSAAKQSQAVLRDPSLQKLVFCLAIFPVFATAIALIGVLGLSAELVQLFLNLVLAAFATVTALSLIKCGQLQLAQPEQPEVTESVSSQEGVIEQPKETPTPVVIEKPLQKKVAEVSVPAEETVSAPAVAMAAPAKPKALAAKSEEESMPAESTEAAATELPKPPAPVRVNKAAQKKYTSSVETATPAAPNAPSKIKAPAKPKKRF